VPWRPTRKVNGFVARVSSRSSPRVSSRSPSSNARTEGFCRKTQNLLLLSVGCGKHSFVTPQASHHKSGNPSSDGFFTLSKRKRRIFQAQDRAIDDFTLRAHASREGRIPGVAEFKKRAGGHRDKPRFPVAGDRVDSKDVIARRALRLRGLYGSGEIRHPKSAIPSHAPATKTYRSGG
jgi:hypothetical protein